ncbi:toxin-antitoxin system HicB family antitoxin [Rhodococcoides corynebacterioides]|uniref:toxin-antitoxin system HicB family antitoxin n=1 Tax=Rhodococcoides corynebacterioides TaxID=53972 RepID=UPI003F81AABC
MSAATKAMTLRLTTEQHTKIAAAARVLGISVQQFVSDAIDQRLTSLRHEYRPTGSNGMRYCVKCNQTEADPNVPCGSAA